MIGAFFEDMRIEVGRYRQQTHTFSINNPSHFSSLVEQIQQQFSIHNAASLVTTDVAILATVTLLAPERSAPPPDILAFLVNKISSHGVTEPLDVLEVVIAYGCGNWRAIDEYSSGWYGVWQPALTALTRAIERPVREANIWLSNHVIGFPPKETWSDISGKYSIQRDAAYLAIRMINPEVLLEVDDGHELIIENQEGGTDISLSSGAYHQFIPFGARAVFRVNGGCQVSNVSDGAKDKHRLLVDNDYMKILATNGATRIMFVCNQADTKIKGMTLAGDDKVSIRSPASMMIMECGCGNENCITRHRLSAWEPSPKISLHSFIASAIKGPHNTISTGTFSQGMYQPLLGQEGVCL